MHGRSHFPVSTESKHIISNMPYISGTQSINENNDTSSNYKNYDTLILLHYISGSNNLLSFKKNKITLV